ncbi:MAG: hypothetical protein NT155_00150 [Candidatus Staskawiczbacteria bacterium]|nr:hypothetical protein [Candidatus Staskawiczbacteria bacterium]
MLKDIVSNQKLTVLTWDEKREIEKDGMTVQFVPLWEWLTDVFLAK